MAAREECLPAAQLAEASPQGNGVAGPSWQTLSETRRRRDFWPSVPDMAPTFDQKQAISSLKSLPTVGVILGAIGGLVLKSTWPHLQMTTFGSGGEDVTGSNTGVAIGWAILWIGNCLLFVALVGWGVKVGREAATVTPPAADG